MSVRRPWVYRPWKGFSLWIGLTAIEFVTMPLPERWTGGLSLLGFLLALGWAQYGPDPDRGQVRQEGAA